jgi:hypothetical protein
VSIGDLTATTSETDDGSVGKPELDERLDLETSMMSDEDFDAFYDQLLIDEVPETNPIVDDIENKGYCGDEPVLDLEIYITKKSQEFNCQATRNHVRLGRPNLSETFLAMKRDVILSAKEGHDRVAVCVSGPRSLSHLCRKACIKYSDASVRFDFHSEPMGM